ncbi:serrate RNA effector molecule [Trichuris trichiura]|uniref:Serrate RNA effector molecule homolog n=1 Tax=Trichuris trichiura TaxID=36087 RepID=A0A077YY07_TRITR|nr:serrate RNA effector molecule [Trichuris trichiura]
MGDSDDEYGRRRSRDKFSRDRSDFQDRRHDFSDRRSFGGGDRDYKHFRSRADYSPPLNKRSRREWDDNTYDTSIRREEQNDNASISPMMTFKQFLSSQDDYITDEEAMKKYQEYKLDYRKQQLHAFFLAHKEQEWFRMKYHPEDSLKKRNEQKAATKRRLDVFMELMDKGYVKKCSLDQDHAENLIKLMDAVVIKLEGGTDEDLEAIEKCEYEEVDEAASEKACKDSDDERTAADKIATSGDELGPKRHDKHSDDEIYASDGELSGRESTKSFSHDKFELNDNDLIKVAKSPKVNDDVIVNKSTSLHRTSSIFLRNLAPNITKQEVEALFKRYCGFLRVSLAEPLQERRFYRRGWVTFRREVNVKEICWNLSSIRVKDCDLGAIVNRDLTRRIRAVNSITGHKAVMQNDLRHVARLVQMYDKRANLWGSKEEGSENTVTDSDDHPLVQGGFAEMSKNPLLSNITDYLVEEANAEEEELLGTATDETNLNGDTKVHFEQDATLTQARAVEFKFLNYGKVIDPLLLYLRIVHSVDYYNHGEYPNEDEMPNRCGLIHVRGSPSVNQSESFVNEFIRNFETKLQPLLTGKEKLSEEEVEKLGKKDREKEVEAFISANCQELAENKWLCPLSGKKFKGPEFVRKHIFNKHPEKVEEVRVEVDYFNNYLYDPKRPFAMETRQQTSYQTGADRVGASDRYQQGQGDYGRQQGFGGGYYRQGGNYRRDYYQRRDYGSQRSYGNNRYYTEGRKDPRAPINYTDLDAPDLGY